MRISTGGETLPVAYEIHLPVEQLIVRLKRMGECREVDSKCKPILVPHNSGHVRVKAENILFIESDGSYCTIHFCDEKKLFVAVPMGTLADDFCEQGVVRCHKRYAVNVDMIDFIGGNYLILKGGTQVDVGRTYKAALTSCFCYRGTKSRKYR
ncbi:MAG: LytTR family transcriptional regulator [Prevotellaceae bacterium]|nr:LytTR family transcriptional regulator [Prevotellaceae bacterium]